MIKFGGTRTKSRKLKYLSTKTRTAKNKHKFSFKPSLKKNTLKQNIVSMLQKRNRLNNIKETYEKTSNIEEQILKTSNKFITLFNKVIKKDKYKKYQSDIEATLIILEDTKGPIIKRHDIKNNDFKSMLEEKVSDDMIETYIDVITLAKETYEDDDNDVDREAAALFLANITEELYNAFFTKKNNVNMNNAYNSGLNSLLKSLKL
jgi:hypothetical protein